MSSNYRLGDRQASEQLIRDLYIDLRGQLNKWSAVTKQTPQARMGYVGQHLVSVVTGIPGGKSGARGNDLVLPNGKFSEIKTCYRIDQLGKCEGCSASVSAIENECPECQGTEIARNDDSKWLLAVKTDDDFAAVLDPEHYYLVLFEFEDINDSDKEAIVAYIWEVDPKSPGFAYCMIDYKLNIQAKSKAKAKSKKSGAPFNLWPWSAKFYMMKPKLIYKAIIEGNNIKTITFPTGRSIEPPTVTPFPYSAEMTRSRTVTLKALVSVLEHFGLDSSSKTKPALMERFETSEAQIDNDKFCDALANAVYGPEIESHIAKLPPNVESKMPKLQTSLC